MTFQNPDYVNYYHEYTYNPEEDFSEYYQGIYDDSGYWENVEVNMEMKQIYDQLGIHTGAERTIITELDNYDPETHEDVCVYGAPELAMQNWEWQEGPTCALYAQKFVIEEVTGSEVDIEDMKAVAEAYGWYDDEGATPVMYMDKMLDYCGIPNETISGMSYEELKESLAQGDRIIAAVDSDEYWYGEYDDIWGMNGGEAPDHAVEIIGLDETDPEHPMLILNDSGLPNGQGIRVPYETFMEAWEDSEFYGVRVPVYRDAELSETPDEVAGGAGGSVEALDERCVGYSSQYFQHEMSRALQNDNKIAYENAKKNWADAMAKEKTRM